MTPDYRPAPYEQPLRVLDGVDRQTRLSQAVTSYTTSGWRVVGGYDFQTMLAWPPPSTNHVLHLLLTVFTCGLWAPAWVLIVIVNGTQGRTLTVYVDEYGRVSTHR